MSNTQAPLRTSLLLTGGIIVVLGQWIFQELPIDEHGMIIWLIVLGALLFLIPLIPLVRNNENPTQLESAIKQISKWFRLSDWQVALLFTSPFLSYIAFVAAGDGALMWNPIAAILA